MLIIHLPRLLVIPVLCLPSLPVSPPPCHVITHVTTHVTTHGISWKPQTKYLSAAHNLLMSMLSLWMFVGCLQTVLENWHGESPVLALHLAYSSFHSRSNNLIPRLDVLYGNARARAAYEAGKVGVRVGSGIRPKKTPKKQNRPAVEGTCSAPRDDVTTHVQVDVLTRNHIPAPGREHAPQGCTDWAEGDHPA